MYNVQWGHKKDNIDLAVVLAKGSEKEMRAELKKALSGTVGTVVEKPAKKPTKQPTKQNANGVQKVA